MGSEDRMLATSVTRVEVRPLPTGVPVDLGSPLLPGSKSHAQRAMLLAAGAPNGVLLHGAPNCRDVEVLAAALGGLGVDVAWRDGGLWIGGGLRYGARASVLLGENGTALRMLPLVVTMMGGEVRVDGDPGLRRRPLGALFDLLSQGGVESSGSSLPVRFDGSCAQWPPRLTVDGAMTTQPASGAIVGAVLRARAGRGRSVINVVAPGARGYVELTAELAMTFGHDVALRETGDGIEVSVGDRAGASPSSYEVPADPSAAVFPAALAALHGRTDRWGTDVSVDSHPDRAIGRDLEQLRSAPVGQPVEIDDLASRPDTFPALCVVAACRAGTTVLRGAPALRSKESDRIGAMSIALQAAGLGCEELDDGLEVRGPLPAIAETVVLPAPPDHRVIMALALLGTVLPGGVALDGAEAVAKSWPSFFDWLGRVAALHPTP